MEVVGIVVMEVNNLRVAVAAVATVGKSFSIEAAVEVVKVVAVVVMTSGTATCVPKTALALRKLCKRILSEICTN